MDLEARSSKCEARAARAVREARVARAARAARTSPTLQEYGKLKFEEQKGVFIYSSRWE